LKTSAYQTTAGGAITDPVLQKALANLQQRFGRGTAAGYQQLPEGPDLRLTAHDIRMRAIENLDVLLATLADKIRTNGG
jgi:L-lactate dehydrogenase complex protein LldF